MFQFTLNGSFGKFNDLAGNDSFMKRRLAKVVDFKLTSPGLYILENVNNLFRYSIPDLGIHSRTVFVPTGVYSVSELTKTINDKLQAVHSNEEKTSNRDAPTLVYNLFHENICIRSESKHTIVLHFDERSILFTLGYGRGSTRKLTFSAPVLTAPSKPCNLYTNPMGTRLSRHQENAFSRMELAARRMDSVFVCLNGNSLVHPLKAGSPSNDCFVANAVAVASLGLPGFPARCLKSDFFPTPNSAIEWSIRKADGTILEDVRENSTITINTER